MVRSPLLTPRLPETPTTGENHLTEVPLRENPVVFSPLGRKEKNKQGSQTASTEPCMEHKLRQEDKGTAISEKDQGPGLERGGLTGPVKQSAYNLAILRQ